MSTEPHVCHESLPVVINTLIKCILTENVHHQAHDLVNQASQKPVNDNRDLKIRISKATVEHYRFPLMNFNIFPANPGTQFWPKLPQGTQVQNRGNFKNYSNFFQSSARHPRRRHAVEGIADGTKV